MVTVRAAVCVITLASLGSGCSVYDESLVSGAAGCSDGSAVPAARPDIPDNDPSTDVAEVTIALRDVRLDTSDTDPDTGIPFWRTIGFNLDERCTSESNQLWACSPPGTNPQRAIDGERGIDNVFGPGLFTLVDIQYQASASPSDLALAPNLQSYATLVVDDGLSAIVLRMRRWNGEPNDSSVTVDISTSVYASPGDASSTPPTHVDGDKPAWDGNDWFWVRDDSFVNEDIATPRTFDNNAYVRDNVVVMRLPDRAELKFVGPTLGLRVALVQGIAIGVLDGQGGLSNVTIGGRWTRTDLLETARAVNVCPEDTGLYTALTSRIDDIADLRSDPENDGDGAPCDAVSFGVSFTGVRGRIAGLVPGPPLPDPCQ